MVHGGRNGGIKVREVRGGDDDERFTERMAALVWDTLPNGIEEGRHRIIVELGVLNRADEAKGARRIKEHAVVEVSMAECVDDVVIVMARKFVVGLSNARRCHGVDAKVDMAKMRVRDKGFGKKWAPRNAAVESSAVGTVEADVVSSAVLVV